MARELPLLMAAAVSLGLAACSRTDGGAGKTAAPGAAAAVPSAPPLAGKEFYRIDAAPLPTCAAGVECEVVLTLTSLGDYKVNEEYPFVFDADATPGLSVDGRGSFARTGKQSGKMTVKLRADAAGTAQLAGVFKLSVCTEATCEIDEPKIALAIPVQ